MSSPMRSRKQVSFGGAGWAVGDDTMGAPKSGHSIHTLRYHGKSLEEAGEHIRIIRPLKASVYLAHVDAYIVNMDSSVAEQTPRAEVWGSDFVVRL